ncbi:MAG TPA: hypothetical protein VGA20_01835 [Gemmatimonadales bacterium]
MSRTWWWILGACTLAACKSDVTRREEIAACSRRSADALEIELCLTGNYRWKPAEARPAAETRSQQLATIRQRREDSVWARGAAQRRDEIRSCEDPDLARCLLVRFGWPEQRAGAAADSVWQANVPRHRREIQECSAQRQSSVGSCLMLRHKWPTQRALALDDSIQRARMR